jgi:hypothetical protein
MQILESQERRRSDKVHRIKTEMKLLRHEKNISFTSMEDINIHSKKKLEAYDMEYFNRVKEIMQKL